MKSIVIVIKIWLFYKKQLFILSVSLERYKR